VTAVDVVVVGAGIGGLRAAANLQDAGLGVVVLEARDRIGGRLLSIASDDRQPSSERIDLGATWFWSNEPVINQLIADAGLEVFPQHLAGDMMFEHGEVQRITGNQLDAPSGRVVAGMQSIAETLAASLPDETIELEQVVTGLRAHETGVTVSVDEREVDAGHVVLAIPPALAVASIDFEGGPDGGLSDHVRSVAASTPVWMGAITKVVAVFDRAFWRDAGLAGSAFSHDGPLREIHDMSGRDGVPAAMFGFCSVSPGEPAPTVEAVTAQLVKLFGPDAGTPLSVHVMDWRNEAYTTPPPALGLTDYRTYGHSAFQQPSLGGRLHWASTETAPVAPGHVEGALAAADRAALAITTAVSRSAS
jgi:monoamine oxidase